MPHVLPNDQSDGPENADRETSTSLPDKAARNAEPRDQLWRYRSQFKTLLEICLEVLHTLSSNESFHSESRLLRQCHHRLHLWSMGSYQQLVDDDTCEWNRGAQALMNSIAVSLIDIAILLANLSNGRTSNTYHQTILASALIDIDPKLVMQYRSQMHWAHESDYGLLEVQDIEYMAKIVERLYTLLPAMRGLLNVAVLEEERRLRSSQQIFETANHINDSPLTISRHNNKEHGFTLADTAVSSYLGMSDLLHSLLVYFANYWKQSKYHAEELQSLHITVLTMPTAKISTSTLAQYAQNEAKMRASPSWGHRQNHKRSEGMGTASRQNPISQNPIAEVLSQDRSDRCEQKLREDRAHRQAALSAGAAGLAIARVLLTRRARLRVRV